ncbi:hypothetical protein I549_5493 [Mycobacterium avium subsp. avium 2285 (R)]|nr:hypothetical protein I549_5493 [Mycobacterium avium subsp. avium 2285 (R)]
MSKLLRAVAAVCVLAGCSSATHPAKVDIAKVAEVKPSFGPDYKVSDTGERGIDPKLLAGRKLPDGLTFDPAQCAKVASGPDLPADLQGNMAAVTAEGRGNRFVVIALETSKALPFNDPGRTAPKSPSPVRNCAAVCKWSTRRRSTARAHWACTGCCRR